MKHASIIGSIITAAILAVSLSSNANAHGPRQIDYEVSVTNLTRGTSFTPILVASHRAGVSLFQLGQPPSDALASMAEGGDTGPLAAMILSTPYADTASGDALVEPGQTVTLTVAADSTAGYLRLAAMMLPTNDGFIALNSVPLPKGRETLTYVSEGYDAGSEPNDESCANIPGPTCGGAGISADAGGEGYVHIHAGIHGIGDLQASDYDWRNPVAIITVRRVHD
jgi:hypothetical protein